ncbi:hypothetical protein D0T51_11780 [Parabacteroides sp. 52]|uniref:hypothetical protein n=1 Tax=unclassified Parabacteroides TaxID=2649774 RepID=UPI0013D62EAF|nr:MULTISPECIES: hypothetical protein [unclassified Parabacteroides]MDH6535710.1 hypothetical protein [Parabacteroides sp. PM5-20]NDV56405.1 hypothetical protein [Parabacteroides sp. 52]
MNREKDILKNLFKQLPEEQLPVDFRTNLMQQVLAESARVKKQNEYGGLIAVILASLAILALATVAFLYMKIPQITIDWSSLTIPSFYFFIGALAFILLVGDYLMRKKYRERHKEE